ncbi:MAG: hypothetical protein JXJ22_16585 [Bacteroidales bacterium]|nr:hypothetical protein [Bacteroidales bacterium]
MLKRSVCLVLVIIVNVILVFSQDNNLVFKHLLTENGLSNNTVKAIIKDSFGFIWIGTEDGLNLYNGYDITVFRNNINDKSTISNQEIFTIFEDAQNNLWIGTRNSLELYNRSTNTFTHYYAIDSSISLTRHAVTAINQDNEGRLWIGTIDIGIFILDSLKNYLKPASNIWPGNISQSILVNYQTIYKDYIGNIWIGSTNMGLIKYFAQKDSFIFYGNTTRNKSVEPLNYISAITGDSSGLLYIGLYGKGLYVFNIQNETYRLLDKPSEINKLPGLKYIFSIIYDQGKLLIATDGSGLNIIDLLSGTISISKAEEYLEHTLTNNALNSLYKDDQNNIWIGHYQGGVDVYLANKKKFDHNYSEPENAMRYGIDRIYSIMEDHNINLWLGLNNGKIVVINLNNKKQKVFTWPGINQSSIDPVSIVTFAIFEDRKNRIWAGAYLQGLSLIDPERGTFKIFKHDPDNPNSLNNNDIRSIIEDSEGKIWMTTNGGGINVMDPNTLKFKHFINDPNNSNSLSNEWARPILEDSEKNIWVGTYYGLCRYNRETNNFTNYFFVANDSTALSNDVIFSIFEDSGRNLWIGTAGGLNLYQKNTNSFISYTIDDGLPNNVINGILEDNSGKLWISTNKGISTFDPQKQTFKNYDNFDGLQSNSFINNSCFKGIDGRMYFGGINGYSAFYPENIKEDPFPPTVLITDIYIKNQLIEVGKEFNGRIILHKRISEIPEVSFTYNENYLKIEFAALQYTSPMNIQYQYFLEGFDKDWNSTDAIHRYASFSNLKPGKYIFHLKAANKDGIWSKNTVSLKIIINPPFWLTWWFIVLVLLVTGVSVLAIILLRYRNIRIQKIWLEQLIEEQTHELKTNHNLLLEQTTQLNETNTILEERQQQIEEQSEVLKSRAEDLISQTEYLETVNTHLEEVNKTKDKLFSIIAHDLKSPFGTIFGFAELLQRKNHSLTIEKRNKYIEALYNSSKKVYSLLENLLEWSRTQTNRIKFEPSDFSCKQIIDEIILIQQENLNIKNLKVACEINESLNVFADYEMIQVIVRNLLNNAIKFTPDNGKITFTCKLHGEDFVEISVKDTGIGIADEIKDNLFQIDKTITTSGTDGEKGTGLGLTLCKDFVEKHGGEIWVISSPGKGSVFSFTIPKSKSV